MNETKKLTAKIRVVVQTPQVGIVVLVVVAHKVLVVSGIVPHHVVVLVHLAVEALGREERQLQQVAAALDEGVL